MCVNLRVNMFSSSMLLKCLFMLTSVSLHESRSISATNTIDFVVVACRASRVGKGSSQGLKEFCVMKAPFLDVRVRMIKESFD